MMGRNTCRGAPSRKRRKFLPVVGESVEYFGKGGLTRSGTVLKVAEDKSKWYIVHDKSNKRLDEWVTGCRLIGLKPNKDIENGRENKSKLASDIAITSASERKKRGLRSIRSRAVVKSASAATGISGNVIDNAVEHQKADKENNKNKEKIKEIETIHFGKHAIAPWYYSPYPKPFDTLPVLYVCEFCFKYNKSVSELRRHVGRKCPIMEPPGKMIYSDGELMVYEVDGARSKIYCQNMCLLSKLFLQDKTLFYDVDDFLFYILVKRSTEGDKADSRCHFIGYFSKEKNSPKDYNLACILTLPPYQGMGYSKLLISLSYELTKVGGKGKRKTGGPEEPLSDLGIRSYHSYWNVAVIQVLIHAAEKKRTMSIEDICTCTGINKRHVVETLERLNLIVNYKGKQTISLQQKCLEKYYNAIESAKLCDGSRLQRS